MDLSIKVWEKNGEYIASCPELDVFCYGIDSTHARNRLKKVIVFYAETASQLGYEIDPKELVSSLEVSSEVSPSRFVN